MSECCCVGMLLCWQGVMSGYVVVNGKTSGDEGTDNHPIWCNPNSSRWLESYINKLALSPMLSLASIPNVYNFIIFAECVEHIWDLARIFINGQFCESHRE